MPKNLVALQVRVPLKTSTPVDIVSSSATGPTVITTATAHNLHIGDQVLIAGHEGPNSPDVNGEQEVLRRLSATQFEINQNVIQAGSGGTVRYNGGHGARYPNFNRLRVVQDAGVDWSIYVDTEGAGWFYDATSGHREGGASPIGFQDAVLLVPQAFATQALAAFPDTFSLQQITPVAFETFHNQRATVREPTEITDDAALARIRTKLAAGRALSDADNDALDPANREPGIRTNRRKRWATRAVDEDVVLS